MFTDRAIVTNPQGPLSTVLEASNSQADAAPGVQCCDNSMEQEAECPGTPTPAPSGHPAVHDTRPKVAVIGAGLGGLAAAVTLAAEGYRVEIFEKNERIGGKLNVMERDGFTFDLGPSILSYPQIFANLFARAGAHLDDFLSLQPLELHWRNLFTDGIRIDLVADMKLQSELLSRHDPRASSQFVRFMRYAERQLDLVEKPYINRGFDSAGAMLRQFSPLGVLRLDALTSMHHGISKYFTSPHLREIFAYFAKYIGSSAEHAPGFLNLLAAVQYRYGLWFVQGGMYNLARALSQLLDQLSVAVHCNSEVSEITHETHTATGIRLADGRFVKADIVVSNMEVIPAHERLLHVTPDNLRPLRRFEPACSGVVIHLGVDRQYTDLAHHNFFHSADQHGFLTSVFDRYELPTDPTVYVVIPTRSEPSLAPRGCDIIKLLPHVAHITDRRRCGPPQYARFRELVIDKCERMGLPDLRTHIVTEHTWTPFDIEQHYYSNRGAIYGVVSDRRKNYAFKAPKRSKRYPNLFFVGGTVNPGPGMPMVVQGGIQAADAILHAYGKPGRWTGRADDLRG